MRRSLILIILGCGLLSLISPQALAQTDEEVDEASRLAPKCEELYFAGKYDETIELCQRILVVYEKKLGSEHPNVATLLNNLAGVYKAKGDYAKAETLFQRALTIYEKALGGEHLYVAISLNNLATLYETKGNYAKAETLFQRALAIYEKTPGDENPRHAEALNNLAGLFVTKGDYVKAETLFQRAVTITEKTLGSEHPNLATSLNNLAMLYRTIGDYTKAEPLYNRALAIREKALGSEHPDVAQSLNNLAVLHQAKGDYAKAEPLFRRDLTITEKALGGEHPTVAITLNNLAELHRMNGAYAKAEPLYNRALAILERTLGSEHATVATSLSNLALLYTAKEDYPRAIEFTMRSQDVRESNINAILATGSEAQKQLYLDTLSGDTKSTVSLHAHSVPSNAQAARLALTTILRRKGRALDAMTDQIAGLRRRADPQDRELLDKLVTARSQLARIQISGQSDLTPAERQAQIIKLKSDVEQLEAQISRRSSEFRVVSQPVTLEAVRAAIPADAALVEIFSYQPVVFASQGAGNRFGAPRYMAYVALRDSVTPLSVDLGDATTIDAQVTSWRTALKDPKRTDVKEIARALDASTMQPIRNLLGATRRLFISPDGSLNLIPFGALVDENGKYLIENYSLTYLTSGRDLLRLQTQSANNNPPVVLANPMFDGSNRPGTEAKALRALFLDAARSSEVKYQTLDFAAERYEPLKGTAAEASAISALLPQAQVFTVGEATESNLKRVTRPRILHIATHGFFLPDQQQPASANTRGLRLEVSKYVSTPNVAPQENPLLRSGLIFAGVNQRASGSNEDGVMTALEVAGLDLWGTKLVVLSACETGLGEVKNGAGVYGLRRALVLAGSETQILSLWQVSDTATRDLMVAYYKLLKTGASRTDALRQVQLAMISGANLEEVGAQRGLGFDKTVSVNTRWNHPYYWAAFIPSGAWTNMDGIAGK